MNFLSTRETSDAVDFQYALFHGLASDGGLYVPAFIPQFDNEFMSQMATLSLSSLGQSVMSLFLPEIRSADIRAIIDNTLSFPIPLKLLEDNIYLLEVFHGQTLAFKDVGARFMAQTMTYYLQKDYRKVTIIVATSGDTGSAIAHAFHHIPNIDVFILYPSKKITFLQEQQMTTLGGNIHALEVEGTFDDCQYLVKQALMDDSLRQHSFLTTANSINVARLLPQIIYHSWGVCQLKQQGVHGHPMLVVPSGNLGNLTAAVYAKAMGFPIQHFVAAVNINNVFPQYIATGQFTPQASKQSYSNAMDVGNPSNIERLFAFYRANPRLLREEISGISVSDVETLAAIKQVYDATGYVLDPHTAVGVISAKKMQNHAIPMIVTATAHPAKFPDVIQRAIQIEVDIPDQLQQALNGRKQAVRISAEYAALKEILLHRDNE